jgi:hypothetical protein
MRRAGDSLPNEAIREREERREAEINAALQLEAASYAAKIKNMDRLRSLRLQREAQQTLAARRRKTATFLISPI